MTAVLFVILIISQLICFYFLVLQHTKIAKFKDLEQKQDQLIREMEDAISLYLVEMKEENDRFIQELSRVEQPTFPQVNEEELQINTMEANSPPTPKEQVKVEPKVLLPKHLAANAYKQQITPKEAPIKPVQESSPKEGKPSTPPPSFEQKVLNFYREGKTVDEIAKLTQKGKTEIELLIKFHA